VIAIYPRGALLRNGRKAEGKEPIGKGWGASRWTREELIREFERYPRAGAGITFGPDRAPGGGWLMEADGDGPKAAESLARLLGQPIDTCGWSSTRGTHALFVADGKRLLDLVAVAGGKEGTGIKAGVWHLEELRDLELRIGGYHANGAVKQIQSVIPPTPGTDGKPREWNGIKTVATLPESAYGFLEALAERQAIQEIEAPQLQPKKPDPFDQNVNNGQYCDSQLDACKAYARKALEDAVATVAGAQQNSRHNVLRDQSLAIAGFVVHTPPLLSEAEYLEGFREADRANGHAAQDGEQDCEALLRGALATATPRDMSGIGIAAASGGEGTEIPSSTAIERQRSAAGGAQKAGNHHRLR
jgi:hypothetical protein